VSEIVWGQPDGPPTRYHGEAYELDSLGDPAVTRPARAKEEKEDRERERRRREKLERLLEESEMKFSHSIQFNAVPDWSSHYIAYSNLKKLYDSPTLPASQLPVIFFPLLFSIRKRVVS
jgi:hypothetical protein